MQIEGEERRENKTSEPETLLSPETGEPETAVKEQRKVCWADGNRQKKDITKEKNSEEARLKRAQRERKLEWLSKDEVELPEYGLFEDEDAQTETEGNVLVFDEQKY